MTKKKSHMGSSFDDFLEEEGILEHCRAVAYKRILAYQLKQAMKEKKISKNALAKRMRTSRPQVDRLLDPERPGVTLTTLVKAAAALGRTLELGLKREVAGRAK